MDMEQDKKTSKASKKSHHPSSSQDSRSFASSQDEHISIPESWSDRIIHWSGWVAVYEKRYAILGTLFLFLCLFIGIGIVSSRRGERSAIASFEASELIREIKATDYSTDTLASVRPPSESAASTDQETNLQQSLEQLAILSHESKAALEKGSGVLALGHMACDQFPSAEGKKADTPSLHDLISLSRNYFSQIGMTHYGEMISCMLDLEQGEYPDREIDVNNSDTERASRMFSLYNVYATILSPTISPQEKAQAARTFFSLYPELVEKIEKIWGQDIEAFYSFLEKDLGQQVAVSSKN